MTCVPPISMEDLYCPNPFCKQPNPITADFCQACHTFLPKRYLWLTGKAIDRLILGNLVHDRYSVVPGSKILLDCYPGHAPEMPNEISLILEAYLKLIHLTPHIPKVYSVVNIENQECLLLEESAIYPHVLPVQASDDEETTVVKPGTLMLTLQEQWSIATPFQLLNWVYQIASLWEGLDRFKATETLFHAECIRVDGDLVKLLELRFTPKNSPQQSLPLLLQHFIHYNDQSDRKADLTIMRRFREIYEKLIHEPEEDHSYLLCEWLDQEMIQYCHGSLDITIVTQTDQGPNRNRNEDACYPSVNQRLTQRHSNSLDPEKPLLVVCDGIGGHEGGNIASNLAIETFSQVLNDRIPKVMGYQAQLNTETILQDAIQISNDAIADRNDEEGRSDRQRMGTTIVLARIEGHRLHLAHVGDSRAYRITSRGCYQLTVDDDIASREVRLGYNLYRDAVQRNGSGALTQALGMVSSSLLHPTIRTSFVNEDCIYLLCSDGLSDFDRVEEFWAQELIPVLQGQTKLADACQNLIEIANAHNGHDNVTVGLLYCKVQDSLSSDRPSIDESYTSGRSPLRSPWRASKAKLAKPQAQSKSQSKLASKPIAKSSDGRSSAADSGLDGVSDSTSSRIKTQLITPESTSDRVSDASSRSGSLRSQPKNSASGWIFIFSILSAIAIVTGLLALLFNPNRTLNSQNSNSTPVNSNPTNPLLPDGLPLNQVIKVLPPIAPADSTPDSSTPDVNPISTQPSNSSTKPEIKSETKLETSPNLALLPTPELPAQGEIDIRVGEIKPGSVLRVVDRRMVTIGNGTAVPWVKLQLCSTESIGAAKQPGVLQPGVEGWHAETTLLIQVAPVTTPLSSIATTACPEVKNKK